MAAMTDLDLYGVPLPQAAGRLNGIYAEPGTIVGPDTSGQYYAALGCDDHGTIFERANRVHVDEAVTVPECRSVAEHHLWRMGRIVAARP